MASTTRSWPGVAELALVALTLLLVGCADRRVGGVFDVVGARTEAGPDGATAVVEQRLALGDEVVEALHHGVAITIRVDAVVIGATPAATASGRFVVRYLPLSERYQLERPGDAGLETYPRLRHVLAALETVRLPLDGAAGEGLRVRVRLDHQRLPSPMRLPALLSGEWRMDSHWTRWPADGTA